MDWKRLRKLYVTEKHSLLSSFTEMTMAAKEPEVCVEKDISFESESTAISSDEEECCEVPPVSSCSWLVLVVLIEAELVVSDELTIDTTVSISLA